MRYILGFILWMVMCTAAAAHEVRPAYLNAAPNAQGGFDIIWKQPVKDNSRLKIAPIFPENCTETEARQLKLQAGTVIETWSINCDLRSGTLALEGLNRTLTDAFLRIEYPDGSLRTSVIKPDAISVNLSEDSTSAAPAYLGIGIDHVLRGWDHLLFIAGLTLLVSARQIIGVATAFTVAHSLTLAVTALGVLTLPGRPVEILIAASIVMLAVEILRKHSGQKSLALKRPWIIAFAIGLVHGFGFAGALAEIGLPRGQELLSLFLFNVGVEIGQILVIVILLAAFWVLGKLSEKAPRRAEILATYVIGGIGMFWVIERMSGYIT